jgi:hypothetical protein
VLAQQVNRATSVGLVVLSLVALLTVLTGAAAALSGQQSPFRQPDEGTLAHVFQLSVAALVPLALLFFATADWTRPLRAARPLALATIVLVVAFATLYYFEHG